MIKICFITTIPATARSFILKFAEYIHKNTDFNIYLISSYDEHFEKELPDYIRYCPVPMQRGININAFNAIYEMYKIFRRERFDLIQYSTPNASCYAAIAGRLAKVPIRLYCQWGMIFVGFTGIRRKIFKTIEKTVCRLSTWIEPDSKSNLAFSHEEGLYPKNMGSVIWNGSACGVNLQKFDVFQKAKYRNQIRTKYHIPQDAFVFGYVGRITRDKGVNELLEATKNLITNNKNIFLLIVGAERADKTVSHELYEWSKECSQIKYVGSTQIVEQFMGAMDCYVLPSYREGFGMSVIEAEAMAVPVIITNIPGPTDGIIKDTTGVVIEKQDTIGLEKAMKKMMTSDLEYYGRNGLEFVKNNFEQTRLFEYILEDRKRLLHVNSTDIRYDG